MTNKLEQLRKMTTVVIDTGDIDSIKKYSPIDATTNPSLVFSAAQSPQYKHLLDEAKRYGKEHGHTQNEIEKLTLARSFVNFGVEILKSIPGRVSTEVDARLSFDVEGSVEMGKLLIAMYEKAGIKRERILIKLASTWEGFQAARILEGLGIHVNMTLMFCLAQAVCSAEVGATLISPFVGRILDWYKKAEGKTSYPPEEDPGVKSVATIYDYLKKFGYKTQVMGASFRNPEEILELAGSDLLTISPQLLETLQGMEGPLVQKLTPENAKASPLKKLSYDEKAFRWALNQDAMATEKLSEGIRNFAKDTDKLYAYLQKE